MARKEKEFLTIIKKSFNEQGAWAIKIPDTPPAAGLRFTVKKELDMIVNINGVHVAIEGKYQNGMKAFSKKALADHQIESLDKQIANNGYAYVFLNVRQPAIKGKQKRMNRCYVFMWEWLKHHFEHNKSVSKAKLEEFEYIEKKNGRFDLTSIIKQF